MIEKNILFKKLTPVKNGHGFTLIEILVVISIIGLLASVVLVSLNNARTKARDAQRLANFNQIVKALSLYFQDNHKYPDPTCPCGDGGWESSSAEVNDWLEALRPYFGANTPVDPINQTVAGVSLFGPRPDSYYFSYYRYAPLPYCACNPASGTCMNVARPVAVLTIRNLENMVPNDLPEADMPLPKSLGLSRAVCGDAGVDGICTRDEYIAGLCRDWSQEFDYSVLLIE